MPDIYYMDNLYNSLINDWAVDLTPYFNKDEKATNYLPVRLNREVRVGRKDASIPLFLAPFALLFVIFIAVPIIIAIGLSFTYFNSVSPPTFSGVGTFPDGNSALMLVCARLRHVAGTQWGNKKYMNMKHLEITGLDESDFIAG